MNGRRIVRSQINRVTGITPIGSSRYESILRRSALNLLTDLPGTRLDYLDTTQGRYADRGRR